MDGVGNQRSERVFRPKEGIVLEGRYRLESPIERGAAGEVWRGRHISIGKRVAIKILRAEHMGRQDDWATKRMLREAQLLSEISHPGVVDVIDFGDHDGCPYIVMELLDGRTLSAALKAGGAMRWHKAGPLLEQMIAGLADAHRAGVIHRDLKPANVILLDEDTRAKIIDFGIAGAPSRTRITMDGEVLGTPHFMSPEQSRTMDLAATSDVYSLGCVAFSMLAGRPPFVGPVGEVVRQHLRGAVPRVADHVGRDVPRQVCAAIERCMAKQPEERFATMEALHVAMLGRPLGMRPQVMTGRTRIRSKKRRNGTAVAVAAGAVVAVGLAAAAVMAWNPSPPPPATTPAAAPPAAAAVVAPPARRPDEPTPTLAPADPGPDPVVVERVERDMKPRSEAPRRPRRTASAEAPVPSEPEVAQAPPEPEPGPVPVAEPAPPPDTTAPRTPADPRWGLKDPFDAP